jgi:hypothetical protein
VTADAPFSMRYVNIASLRPHLRELMAALSARQIHRDRTMERTNHDGDRVYGHLERADVLHLQGEDRRHLASALRVP